MKMQFYFSENKTFQWLRLRQNNAHQVLLHCTDMLALLSLIAVDLIYRSGF